MKSLKEFSETTVNRSNNAGKLNYLVLSELLERKFEDKNWIRFSSKSNEKKELRKIWQKYILSAAENINTYSQNEKKELFDTIVKVQGAFKNAKELYNAKNFEKENLAKELFSGLKSFLNANKKEEVVKPVVKK